MGQNGPIKVPQGMDRCSQVRTDKVTPESPDKVLDNVTNHKHNYTEEYTPLLQSRSPKRVDCF